MTEFEEAIEIFKEQLILGISSYFTVKYDGDTFSIETDDEKFYYDEKTGREL